MDLLETRYGKASPVRAEADRLVVSISGNDKGFRVISVHDCRLSSRQAFVDFWKRLGGPEQGLCYRKDDGTLAPFEPKA